MKRLAVGVGLVLLVSVAGTSAWARCGKQSQRFGRSQCQASTGKLLLKFEDFWTNGAGTDNPRDDEFDANDGVGGFYGAISGLTSSTMSAADGDPTFLPAGFGTGKAELYGKAVCFDPDTTVGKNCAANAAPSNAERYIQIPDDGGVVSPGGQLDTKFEFYASFWIRPHCKSGACGGGMDPATILYKGETSGAKTCNANTVSCRNYQVDLNAAGTLTIRTTRSDNPSSAPMSCTTNATDLSAAPPALVVDKWQEVTIGFFIDHNCQNAGYQGGGCSAGGTVSSGFRYLYNNVQYANSGTTATCLPLNTGAAAGEEFMTDYDKGVHWPTYIGTGHGAVGNVNAPSGSWFDLDELRLDIFDGTEAATVGCGIGKPQCQACAGTTFARTGCRRSDIGGSQMNTTINNMPGQGADNLDGLVIQQVLFNEPNQWERVLLYRPFTSAAPTTSLSGMTLFESGASSPGDDGFSGAFNFPALTIAPGDFAEVMLCPSGASGCVNSGQKSPCTQFATANNPATCTGSELGCVPTWNSATVPQPCPPGSGACFNGNQPGSLEVDSALLQLSPAANHQSGPVVAWSAAGVAEPTAEVSSLLGPGGTGESSDNYGIWPTTIAATGLSNAAKTVPLTNNATVFGLKLKNDGDNSSPNVDDATVANRDWQEINAGNMASTQLICDGAGALSVGQFLESFDGFGLDQAVHLQWVTGEEDQTEGFRLFRSMTGPDGAHVPVGDLIPAQQSIVGASYGFTDTGLTNGAVVWYGIEMLNLSGSIIDTRKVQVVVGVPHSHPRGCATIASRDAAPVPGAIFTGAIALFGFLVVRTRRDGRA